MINFPIRPKNIEEIYSIFGNPEIHRDSHGNLKVSNEWESKYLTLIHSPILLPRKVYCHKMLAPILTEIFYEISDKGLEQYIYTWDGCFNPRVIKGSDKPSSHTFAASVDFNAPFNPMGLSWYANSNPKKTSISLITIFEKYGMVWGEKFTRHDPMHFSLIYW